MGNERTSQRPSLRIIDGERSDVPAEPLPSASEQLLGSIIQQVSDLVFLLERDDGGRFIVIATNAAVAEETGYPEDALIGRPIDRLLEPADARVFTGMLSRVVATGEAMVGTATARMPTGAMTARMTLAPVLDDHGHPTHVLGVAHVLAGGTGRGAEADDAALGTTLLTAMPCPAAVVDAAGVITAINSGWRDAASRTRKPADWLPGASLLEAVRHADGEPRDEIVAGLRAVLAEERPVFATDGWVRHGDRTVRLCLQAMGVAGRRYGAVVSVREPGFVRR